MQGSVEDFLNPPPRNLELRNGEAHIFCGRLDQSLDRLRHFAGILSEDERVRAGRFAFMRDRNRFLAGRGMLREILGRLLRTNPAGLRFAYGIKGKPRLAAPVDGRFLKFNLAHADTLAVYIVSARSAVGVDIERIRPIPEAAAIMSQFFSPQENEAWRSLPAEHQAGAFIEYWTCQEALLKAIGGSLGSRLIRSCFKSIADRISPTPGTLRMVSNTTAFSLYLPPPFCGYQAAAAIQGECPPTCWSWPTN